MVTDQNTQNINRDELHRRLTERLALLLTGLGLLMLWSMLPTPRRSVVSTSSLSLAIALTLLGIGVWALVSKRLAWARHLLIWGLLAGLLNAMLVFGDPWLPFLALMLTFLGAMLVQGGEVVIVIAVAVLAYWLTYSGTRPYPFFSLFFALVVSGVLARLTVHVLYTALEWALTMQQRADRLLEMTQKHRGELGRTVKALELAYDLQRRTQQELVFARRQAELAAQMKERFAANISHELRTPLNIILGFSEIMHLSPAVYGEMVWPDTLRRDIYQIYANSRHLLEMVDDILDLAKFEMVGFTLNKEITSLESLLREAVAISQDLFRNTAVRLEVNIAEGLPLLEIDRTRIRQVVLNLLNNAQRFTSEGIVRLEAKQEGREVIVSVTDTGTGIPEDKLPYIFEEFYQVDQTIRRKQQGAGLGLSICKRFVEAHEGRIWAKSQEGVGSTFSFALPIPGEFVSISRLTGQRLDPVKPESQACILVHEPDPNVLKMIRRHMPEYEVIQVESADRLTEAVAHHHPRAVVCNVQPGENGHLCRTKYFTISHCRLLQSGKSARG